MKKKTILVVDDEADLLEIVKTHLEDAGYEIITALGGREGLLSAKRVNPDLIILDIAMPDIGGFEMLEILRGQPEFFKKPVIMLTAQGQTANIFEAERMRVADFIIKPFTREELLAAVRKSA